MILKSIVTPMLTTDQSDSTGIAINLRDCMRDCTHNWVNCIDNCDYHFPDTKCYNGCDLANSVCTYYCF